MQINQQEGVKPKMIGKFKKWCKLARGVKRKSVKQGFL
jgi:hypothetical protein